MRNRHIEIHPVVGALGAEITGVDVAQDLSDATIGQIRRALLDHCVIFFRDQTLDVAQHKVFTCRFRRANRSIAFWDNCCTRHLAVHDAGPFRRIIRRIQIACDRVHLL